MIRPRWFAPGENTAEIDIVGVLGTLSWVLSGGCGPDLSDQAQIKLEQALWSVLWLPQAVSAVSMGVQLGGKDGPDRGDGVSKAMKT